MTLIPTPGGGRFALEPPIEPMLAKPVASLPESSSGLTFEPKWDGFRCLIYRRGDDVAIQGRMRAADAASTGAWDLTYAFPEMAEQIRQLAVQDVVLDGELVIVREQRLSFDSLGMRLRPRKEAGGWKIAELARDLPTTFVAFDVLAIGDRDLRQEASSARRAALIEALAGAPAPIRVTSTTRELEQARRWFDELPGAGLDGLIIRPDSGTYTPGKRTLFKLKPVHTVDVVCAGWRPFARPGPQGQEVVGSVLVGVYDDAGVLHSIGAMSAFPMAQRQALAEQFAGMTAGAEHPWFHAQGRAPGEPSRWSGGRSAAWNPLPPVLVAEISYNQFDGGRLRHPAAFVRWRPDKDPAECTVAGLVAPEPMDVRELLGSA